MEFKDLKIGDKFIFDKDASIFTSAKVYEKRRGTHAFDTLAHCISPNRTEADDMSDNILNCGVIELEL